MNAALSERHSNCMITAASMFPIQKHLFGIVIELPQIARTVQKAVVDVEFMRSESAILQQKYYHLETL